MSALFAAGVRPTGGYPEPVEATADLALGAGQMVLAALLGPALLGTRTRSTRAAVAAVPFMVLAARLANRPTVDSLGLAAVTFAWLAALAVITRFPTGRHLAVFAAVGWPVLLYARTEYAGQPWPTGTWMAFASPTLGVLTTGPHSPLLHVLWVPTSVLLIAVAARFAR